MPKWIRVRDVQTNHTFDIEARTLKHRAGVEPVDDPQRWPDLEGPRAAPRPAKPFVGKDGRARAAGAEQAPDGGGQTDAGRQSPDAASDGGPVEQQGNDATSARGRRRSSKDTTPADTPADTSKEQQP